MKISSQISTPDRAFAANGSSVKGGNFSKIDDKSNHTNSNEDSK